MALANQGYLQSEILVQAISSDLVTKEECMGSWNGITFAARKGNYKPFSDSRRLTCRGQKTTQKSQFNRDGNCFCCKKEEKTQRSVFCPSPQTERNRLAHFPLWSDLSLKKTRWHLHSPKRCIQKGADSPQIDLWSHFLDGNNERTKDEEGELWLTMTRNTFQ